MVEGCRSAQRLDLFGQLKPAQLGGRLFDAGAVDGCSQAGEGLCVSRVQVGVGERGFVTGDAAVDLVDALGQEVVVALVLVSQFGARLWRLTGYLL